jgi:23S rRNA pseudouridine1911/1915/1917 synthase
VHRLDKHTSGVMVAAKTQQANAALTAAFAARDLDRAYLALVWGLPTPLEGDIEGAIGRDSRDRKRMAVVARGGKPALTHYRTLRAWGTAVSLLECRLATGRTHQIRVHLAARGHPVVGDPVYLRRVPAAARSLPEPIRQLLLDFPRQALHAASLGFTHPRTGKPLSFAADVPPEMAALIAALDRDLRPVQG